MSFYQRDLLSIGDLSQEEILLCLRKAIELKNQPQKELLKEKILASCFFEPSTRTRLSFESAMLRLGGKVVGFAQGNSSSASKGETLFDSMKVIGEYADLIVIRHPLEGSAKVAANATHTPVINAGDGSHQHPTQTLLDLFTIQECQGRLEDLHIGMCGDLRHGRTVHSLAPALAYFNPRLYFICPPQLEMPDSLCEELRTGGVRFSFHESLKEVMTKLDILYVTRLQTERLDGDLKTQVNYTRLSTDLLKMAKENLRILHPLPRVQELPVQIDATPYAYYFQQARNGLYVRQALLALILENSFHG